MAFSTIKEVFEHHVTRKIDKRFAMDLIAQYQRFISKNETHALFFGSPYIGVYPIRYTTADAIGFLEDVLGIEDTRECQTDLYALDEINPDFFVSSDVVNLAFIYAAHTVLNETSIDERLREQAAIHTVAMGIGKHLCSQLTRRFHFSADMQIAAMLYESLDNKTDLKVYGTWNNLLLARGEQAIDPKRGLHMKRGGLKDMSPDKEVVYMANDIQDRIVGVLNIMTEKFHEIKDSQGRILSQSTMTSIEGEKVLREYVRKESKLVEDMNDLARDPRNLIRDEVIDATAAVMTTTAEESLRDVLKYFSDNYNAPRSIHPKMTESLVLYVMQEAKHSRLDLNDLYAVTQRVSSIFRSSRTKKGEVLEIKKYALEISKEAIPRARESIQISTAIGLAIYLTIRMLSIPKYR